tara:strand:- start:671 stop:817 length:147 start_codon:yes stop_codon:yes gene_type:complete
MGLPPEKFEEQCPYKRSDGRRYAWYAGWYDARIWSRLGHVFEKYGLKY